MSAFGFKKFKSLISIANYFSDKDRCRKVIEDARWGEGSSRVVVCPHCKCAVCTRCTDGRYRCHHCHTNFSYLVGTVFENTKTDLQKWFMAMYLISTHKKGISSYQLAKDIEVTQATAWHMLHKLRMLLYQSDSVALKGVIECDEVYIGGKEKWKHESMKTPHTQGRSTKTKTPVFGMMERSEFINSKGMTERMSTIRAVVVENTTGNTLLPIIGQFVEEGSRVTTDELSAYCKLSTMGYTHNVVRHNSGEYVKDGVFTNDVEGFWSHFRRMINGVYHDCSDKYLQKYVDEAAYRWNTRKQSQQQKFEDMFSRSIGCVVTWEELKMAA